MAYALHPQKNSSLQLVGWDPGQGDFAWRDVFAEPQLRPAGLLKLAQLNKRSAAQTVCGWVSLNGLLGFRPTPNPVEPGGYVIPSYVGEARIHHYEPLDCIRAAAQRAGNVLALWSALKTSYATGQERGSDRVLRLIVIFDETDSYEHRQVRSQRPVPKSLRGWRDAARTSRRNGYQVLSNGERRSQRPIPNTPARLAQARLCASS